MFILDDGTFQLDMFGVTIDFLFMVTNGLINPNLVMLSIISLPPERATLQSSDVDDGHGRLSSWFFLSRLGKLVLGS